jgi:hypothetical protein
MASGGGALMKYRMHKRIETKPDGRKIYYYTFEPAETQERDTPAEPDPEMLATLEAIHARLEAAGHRPPTPEEVRASVE